jgi:uncharacterized protein
MKKSDKWYDGGLKFTCVKCGQCCQINGDYAYVYLTQEETGRIMDSLEIPRKEFMKNFCSRLEGRMILRFRDGNCPFLEEGRCTIYRVRPVQCRTWPFWEENLDEWTWHEEVAAICPGANRGRCFSLREIEKACRNVNEHLGIETETF